MDKIDKDLELKKIELEQKKLEIEKLKLLENHLRTLSLMIIAIGTGAGTLIQILYSSYEVKKFLLSALLSFLLVFALVFILLWIKLLKKLKEIERWMQ